MENPPVEVTEILESNVSELVEKHSPRGVNLGNRAQESTLNEVISKTRKQGGRRFLLAWTGNKVPYGARVLQHLVAWTQNGMVSSQEKRCIGSYDRLIEFGGDSGKEQLMIVYLYPSEG